MTPERIAVILLAAGSSTRMLGVDKVWADLCGEPVIARSLNAAASLDGVTDMIVVTAAARHDEVQTLATLLGVATRCVEGGARRQDSVAAGIAAAAEADWYVVHDAARPLAGAALFAAILDAARAHGAAIPVVPVVDTVKRIDASGGVAETLDRAALRAVQTPQAFAGPLLRRAHAEVGADATDDASMVEALGERVMTVPGAPANLKVTTPADLVLARALWAGIAEE